MVNRRMHFLDIRENVNGSLFVQRFSLYYIENVCRIRYKSKLMSLYRSELFDKIRSTAKHTYHTAVSGL